MLKKKKVRAGVLLYAITIAGIFSYHTDEKGFLTIVTSGKNQFEFRFSPLEKTEDKTKKTENKSKEGNEEKKEEGGKKETAKSSEVTPSKKDTE